MLLRIINIQHVIVPKFISQENQLRMWKITCNPHIPVSTSLQGMTLKQCLEHGLKVIQEV
jgi:hypothetical protein